VVVALGLELEVGPAWVVLTTTTGRPATAGGNGGPGGATNQPIPAVTSSGAVAIQAAKAAATSRARSIG
jgi:hypothetical protein